MYSQPFWWHLHLPGSKKIAMTLFEFKDNHKSDTNQRHILHLKKPHYYVDQISSGYSFTWFNSWLPRKLW